MTMKQIAKVVAVSAVCAATLFGAGWKIPEQSLNAVAMSAANVADANGADASYYNPANMVWMDNNYHLEGAMTYIKLPSINFDNASAIPGTRDEKSKQEDFLLPTMHIVTPEYYKNWRFGFSTVAPGGLAKRWEGPYAGATANEFSIKIIEANPTAAYKVNDQFAIGFGLRAVYIEGKIRSDAAGLGVGLARDMEADTIEYGYNLALSYRPTQDLKLAATYRSNVNLGVEGSAKIYAPGAGLIYDGPASTEIPLPATLNLAVAYSMNKTTVEFVYERVYWSKYKALDFEYSATLPVFDDPVDKNWEDTNTYRIGVSHQYNSDLKLMAGFAIDETPAQVDTLGFELPDSDAKIYSIGFEYKIDKDMTFGMAYLYSHKESVSADIVGSTPPITAVQGTFSDAAAHLVNASIKYKF